MTTQHTNTEIVAHMLAAYVAKAACRLKNKQVLGRVWCANRDNFHALEKKETKFSLRRKRKRMKGTFAEKPFIEEAVRTNYWRIQNQGGDARKAWHSKRNKPNHPLLRKTAALSTKFERRKLLKKKKRVFVF
jgi:hypothetical protein